MQRGKNHIRSSTFNARISLELRLLRQCVNLLMVFARDVDSVDFDDAISDPEPASLCRRPALNVPYIVAVSALDREQVEAVSREVGPRTQVTESHHRSSTASLVRCRISNSRHRIGRFLRPV